MTAIYTPKGRAREYGAKAVNLATGCSHGCVYCYAPAALRKDRATFKRYTTPRSGILDAIRKEAPKHRGKDVFFCFACDPCMNPTMTNLTARSVSALSAHDVAANVLTKGEPSPALFEALALNDRSRFGMTITTLQMDISARWEPKASLPATRLNTLQAARDAGLFTWISFEPVYSTGDVLFLLTMKDLPADHVRIGKMNHVKDLPDELRNQVARIDWPSFRSAVRFTMQNRGWAESTDPDAWEPNTYYIKKDLLEAR